jgi:hypothetical protein
MRSWFCDPDTSVRSHFRPWDTVNQDPVPYRWMQRRMKPVIVQDYAIARYASKGYYTSGYTGTKYSQFDYYTGGYAGLGKFSVGIPNNPPNPGGGPRTPPSGGAG